MVQAVASLEWLEEVFSNVFTARGGFKSGFGQLKRCESR